MTALLLGGVIVLSIVLYARSRSRTGAGMPMFCTNCGTVGRPVTVTKGSIALELLLWLCFLLPGILYSVWRLSSRYRACPSCRAGNMIPTDSPRARERLEIRRAGP
jgi:tellurite resistance protein TehA-like permease